MAWSLSTQDWFYNVRSTVKSPQEPFLAVSGIRLEAHNIAVLGLRASMKREKDMNREARPQTGNNHEKG